jgi:hypothetical protein
LRTTEEAPSAARLEVPPPAFFIRSVPITPTAKWMRAKLVLQGPLVAGLALALAAGLGMGLGLTPSCALTAPLPGEEPGSDPMAVSQAAVPALRAVPVARAGGHGSPAGSGSRRHSGPDGPPPGG